MPTVLRLITVVLSLLVATMPAHADLKIEITQGVLDPVPIAVVPFGWQGSLTDPPVDIAAVISRDLASSGQFAPVARNDMLEFPSTSSEVDFEDWRLLGTDVVVIGKLSEEEQEEGPNNYRIQFQVFDVFRGEQLLGYRMESGRNAIRASAHHASDLIFEKLTGIRGAFSTRIAYITVQRSDEQTTHQLIVADADGENRSIIAESPEPIMSPTWSPDSRKLAYVAFENGNPGIYVQTLETGSRQRISARRGVNGAPAWSADGRMLAVTLSQVDGNLDIHTLNPVTGKTRRITTNPAIDTEPVWSGDGRTIFFTSDRSGGPQVYRIDIETGVSRRVSFEGNYNARPRLAPDEKQIAMVHNDRGNYRIAVLDLDGGELQVLTDGNLDESPSFAPNGSMIIYATRDRGMGILAAVSVDGRVHQRLISQEGEVREPAWSPFPRSL